ncbi:hypothetical protein ABFS83_06G119100 [Erythranthe nasuta]
MQNPSSSSTSKDDEENALLNSLPKARFWNIVELRQWEGYWFEPGLLKSAITFRSSFHARNDDVLLASPIKTGTTWLKSLSLCIITRNLQTLDEEENDILTKGSPHFHVPTVETSVYSTEEAAPPRAAIYEAAASAAAPRLLHTHLPYAVLSDSVKESEGCKIVYIARNPKDTLISMWHFFNSQFGPLTDGGGGPFPLEAAVDCFCSGVHIYGSFFDHVVEYWVESRKRPEKVLFVKYEDLKCEPKRYVSEIAEFLGRPFGEDDEIGVDEVLRRCSLERLKNLEVNKTGSVVFPWPNSSYFRKGEVGDSKNYLTAEMERRIDETSRLKLEPFGLFL